MSEVRFTKVLQTSTVTKMPGAADSNWVEGFNAGAGTMEYMLLRGDCTWAADPIANGSMSNLLDTMRIIINGEVAFDFRSGFEGATEGLFGYFLNSIGGASSEVTTGTTTREWYWAIPLGRTYKNTDVVRIETVIGWKAVGGAAGSQHQVFATDIQPNLHGFRLAQTPPFDRRAEMIIIVAAEADRLGFDGIGKYDTFVHLDLRGEKARWDERTV